MSEKTHHRNFAPDDEKPATQQVADRLAMIILKTMQPNTNMPTEAELADQFKVSRLTIREALKILAGRGLVDLGRGRRARTKAPDGSAFADFLTAAVLSDTRGLFDLMELRMALETQTAALAAKRATRAGVLGLERALEGMQSCAEGEGSMGEEDEIRFNGFDVQFHESIAAASGNRVLMTLFEGLAPPFFESFMQSRRGQRQRGHTRRSTIAAHQEIIDAIVAQDADRASEAMRKHLESSLLDISVGLNIEPRKFD